MPLKSRKTRQKEVLESEMQNLDSFFTAEDLFGLVSRKNPEIGIATIYRFLKQKNENQEIHCYNCNGKSLYSIEKKNHSHFICKQCGETTHFDMEDIGTIKKSVKDEMCHFQLDVYGICKKCKR